MYRHKWFYSNAQKGMLKKKLQSGISVIHLSVYLYEGILVFIHFKVCMHVSTYVYMYACMYVCMYRVHTLKK